MDKPVQKDLKDKWNDHWGKQPMKSKHLQANWAGIAFYWVCSIVLLYASLKFSIKHHYNCRFDYEMKAFFRTSWFLFIQCGMNWVVCAFRRRCNDVPQIGLLAERSNTEDWTHCSVCQNDVPPRGYHCKICNTCILKRDHHCFITGTCVGYYNQRHYIVFLFYSFIGSCFSLYLSIHFFSTEKVSMGWKMFPLFALISYIRRDWSVTGERLCLSFMLFLSLILVIVTGYFLWLQVNTILSGRTTRESNNNIKKYQNDNKLENFRSIFGPYGLVQFIVPVPFLSHSGDGFQWNSKVFSKWQ